MGSAHELYEEVGKEKRGEGRRRGVGESERGDTIVRYTGQR